MAVFGADIISNRTGLLCRAPSCPGASFIPYDDSMESLRDAIASRDEHELDTHNYVHVPQPTPGPKVGRTLSFHGRSVLPRRRGKSWVWPK